MTISWYKKALPTVGEVKKYLPSLKKELSCVRGVKSIYVFGSLAEHYNEPNYRIKDIDIIIASPFNSEDLQSINEDTISYKPEFLESDGYDLAAVNFSKKLAKTNYLLVDKWCLSSDKKLLHWGPIGSTISENLEIKNEAEKYASQEIGFNLSKLKKASEEHKNNWYKAFKDYHKKEYDTLPIGWYVSEEKNIKDIVKNAIRL